MIEQNAHKALKLSHRAYIMSTGRILFEGTGEELSENQQIMSAYLGG
ncbi:MAG: hypothetical protein HFI23_04730 [Lachnospiraceae bacterium]|nr:hypothetical protein [Lachnospiraceae bacterium]MCI9622619.1 hypothetical protein [Lachnospiraceae bacterium]